MAAVKQDIYLALKFASEELEDDYANYYSIVKAAVKQDGLALEFASEELRDNHDIVKTAVMMNGIAFRYASEKLQKNQILMQKVAKKEPSYALKYADKTQSNNQTFMLAAVKQNAEALQYASEKLQNNPEFVRSAVVTNYRALKYIKDDFLFLLVQGLKSPKFCLNCFRYFGLSFRTFNMIVALSLILLVFPIYFLVLNINIKRQQLFSHFLNVSPCSTKQPSSNNIGKVQRESTKVPTPSSKNHQIKTPSLS